MKKFLVLGIGNAQVDLLHYLRKQPDILIHSLSNSINGRGYKLTDHFSEIDIVDKKAVLAYSLKNQIDYIYSVGSDIAMPTAMWVANKLNLPCFVTPQTASICNRKHELRASLKGMYGSVPYSVLSEDNLVNDIEYPAIVKPADSQGQRGITTVINSEELFIAYQFALKYSRSKTVLVEKKIEGPEISVNTYILNGKLVFFLPSDRIPWYDLDGGIIHKHILPASLSKQAIKNVRRLVIEILNKLNINNGPAYFQIKMDGDSPYLIEVTPRLDGCHMWRLIAECTGIDLLDISIKHMLGKEIDLPVEFKTKSGVLQFICQQPHTIYNQHTIKNNYQYFEEYYRDGDFVKEMNGKLEKCGYSIHVGSK